MCALIIIVMDLLWEAIGWLDRIWLIGIIRNTIMVNLHNYCLDDININMKWYILYIMYSTHLSSFQAVLTIIYLAKRLES